ncbi:MAG: carboxypeptidase regulatory-like domain-containing protein [Elusimicrobia bacterium]|nr:carboxypeptidase regulatory-like domain-containing protein [Elusimicrobiota bacterium]
MIAVAVLSVAIVGLVGAFGGVQKALMMSKTTTLASTLAQEQMQILKQKAYFQVLVTTNPSYNTSYTPNIPYDGGYFPPETVLEGGVTYNRSTYIQFAMENSGVIQPVGPLTPDTGLKLITVDVTWSIGGQAKHIQLLSVLSNPDTVMTNAIFQGTVRDAATLAPIQNALANIAENLGWRDSTDATGHYGMNVSPGSYTLGVTVPGYFPAHLSASIAANATVTQDFNLQPMSSGSATGVAWFNPNLVISQVVVSSAQADQANFQAQYVELFNPTSSTIVVYDGAAPQIKLKVVSGCSGAGNIDCSSTNGIKLDYANTSVGPGKYYLIANTGTFTVNGRTMTADATYRDDANTFCTYSGGFTTYWNTTASPPLKLMAPYGHGATLFITDASNAILDAVGYSHGAIVGANCETGCISMVNGGVQGEQFVRITSPTWTAADLSNFGRAYDSDNNTVDITSTTGGIVYSPYQSSDAAVSVATGKPAVGAVVSATDGLSLSTRAYSSGSPPVARYALTQIATGTWTVLVTSRSWTLENDTVTIAATGSTYVFPATMSWLTSPSSDAFISGTVTDVLGAPIGTAVPVDSGGQGPVGYANTTNGRYLLRVSTVGFVDVTANSGAGAVPNYIAGSSLAVATALGQITSGVNFTLSQGGRIAGFATRDGVNALPGVAFTFLDANGYSHDQQVSGTNGRFTTLNIATGSYYVEPVLDVIETASPSSATVTVTPGGTAWSSTFTISGALGTISGSVSLGGKPLTTGVLIVVTTATLAGTPPAPPTLNVASLSGSPYYLDSSHEDGTYSVDVRQSTSPAYRVYAYYVTYSGATPSISAQTLTGVQVLAGQTVTGKDFAW